jgi:hypothetical protein
MASRKRAAKFKSSVVMRFLFAGWFSATAEGKSNLYQPFSKQGFFNLSFTGRTTNGRSGWELCENHG